MKVKNILMLFLASSWLVPSTAEPANWTTPSAGRVSVELVASFANFSNTLSIVSPAIGVAITGCQLQPASGLGGVHVVSEKLSQRGCRADLDADSAMAGIQGFPAGTTFEFGMCAQTDADAACEFVWSSDPTKNSDNLDHVQTDVLAPGVVRLSWEDLENLGDNDFNDLIVVVRVQSDTDGDGLWDDWESSGIDTDGLGGPDFFLPGASPNHRDIFLEIDYMDCAESGGDCIMSDTHSHEPKQDALDAVIAAFDAAPIMNPDGMSGINLHIDVSDAIPHQNFLSIGCGFSGPGIGVFDDVKSDPAFFGPSNPRRFAYHYAIFGHRQASTTTSSGCAELPGNDSLVTLGEWNTTCIWPGANNTLNTAASGDDLAIGRFMYSGPDLVCDSTASGDDVQAVPTGSSPTADVDTDGLDDRTTGTIQQQAGTLMHEFGHNLQLCHGGEYDSPTFAQCNTNFKPNYLSIMNYSFQIPGIPPTDPDAGGPLSLRVDYSPADLADLNENSLNEPAGIGDGTDNTFYRCPNGSQAVGVGTGAIDWNCDGDGGTDASVAVDVNADGSFMTLRGHDDWANLKLDFQNTTDFEDGVHDSTLNVVEIDVPLVIELATPIANCASVVVPNEPGVCYADASIDDGSFDPDGGPLDLMQSPAGPYGLGDTEVTLTATDDTGLFASCMATVTVMDVEPPTITSITPSPGVLWPPNHELVPVTLDVVATDNCDGAAACRILSVSSNEPSDGRGDGNVAPDWEIKGDLSLNLRAERSGTGSGREYTIEVECHDPSGNQTTGTTVVSVAHSQGR